MWGEVSNEQRCMDVAGCNIFVIVVNTAIRDFFIFTKHPYYGIAFHVYIFVIIDLINSCTVTSTIGRW